MFSRLPRIEAIFARSRGGGVEGLGGSGVGGTAGVLFSGMLK